MAVNPNCDTNTRASDLYYGGDSGASSSLMQYGLSATPAVNRSASTKDINTLTEPSADFVVCDSQVQNLSPSTSMLHTGIIDIDDNRQALGCATVYATEDLSQEEPQYSSSSFDRHDDHYNDDGNNNNDNKNSSSLYGISIDKDDQQHMMVTCEEELSVLMDSCCTMSSTSTASCITSITPHEDDDGTDSVLPSVCTAFSSSSSSSLQVRCHGENGITSTTPSHHHHHRHQQQQQQSRRYQSSLHHETAWEVGVHTSTQRPRAWTTSTCNAYACQRMVPVKTQDEEERRTVAQVKLNADERVRRAPGAVHPRPSVKGLPLGRPNVSDNMYHKWLAGMPFSRRMRFEQQLLGMCFFLVLVSYES